MKTAKQLRDEISNMGEKIAKQMNAECRIANNDGKTDHIFLQDESIATRNIDFAISEMVGLGFTIEQLEKSHEESPYLRFKISW